MASMPGRHILEGVVVFHETIHELHRKKMDGVLLKIDFEKAYEKSIGLFFNRPCAWRVLNHSGVSGFRTLLVDGA
jgi:hypothetical protein